MSVVIEANRNIFQQNPNVHSVTSSNIRYTSKFMKHALEPYESGVIDCLIWEKAGCSTEYCLTGYFHKVLKRRESQAQRVEIQI